MNRQQRYESLPQRDEVIILDSINSPNYNYNSGIPTSVASSSHGGPPSISPYPPSIAPSIPNSPPPSFHTHSSPPTPRPTPSTVGGGPHHVNVRGGEGQSYAELWGVAPSTVGGETITTSNDALATISSLKQRVEWLEESIGRLLLENEATKNGLPPDEKRGENCCVSFTDASPEIERGIANSHQNCCVTFQSTGRDAKIRKDRQNIFAALVICFFVGFFVTVIMGIKFKFESQHGGKVGGEGADMG